MSAPTIAVLIVGAGPSGLALAIELGSRGVRCLVIERNARVGLSPRAKTTNVRTRTHLRRWGIADRLAAASPFGVDWPADVHFVTRLGGPSLAVIPDTSNCAPVRCDDFPEHGQWIPQYKLEQVMREHADSLPGVELRFGVELVSASQDDDGVDAVVRTAEGATARLRATYLVGADGARSVVREAIGTTMTGTYGLSRNYNIVFRAPGLAAAHSHGPGSMYWHVNCDGPGLIGPMDAGDIWFFMPTRLPPGFVITTASAADLIRRSTGIDLPYEVLSSDEWIASCLIATRYRDRRLLLAGDACHLHPPFGGFGMNMGVADGVDLGWKLAACLAGWGGAALLDSYEAERREVHAAVIAEAERNHHLLSNDFWRDGLDAPGPAGDAARGAVGRRIVAEKTREFHTLGTVLGGCYTASPVITYDDAPAVVSEPTCYRPSSAPGCLAPHFWRADGTSLYDAFGPSWTVLARPDADPEALAATVAAADRLGMPLVAVTLVAAEPLTRYPVPLTLVRPDQYVAARGRRITPAMLARAAGTDPAADVG